MKKFKKRSGSRKHSNRGSGLKKNEKDNAPPLNPGVQDVPKSLKEFLKLKELAAESAKEEKEKKQLRKNDRTPTLQSTSTSSATEDVNRPVVHDASLRTRLELDDSNQPKARSMNVKKKRKLKLMKLKLKRKLKKEQKKESEDELVKDLVKEDIKFGEVVHRPPELSVRPRKVTKTGFENRPGRKDDLLLKSLLNQTDLNKRQLCQKRKYLSISDQRQLELERKKALLSYKNIKRKTNKII